MKTFLPKIDVDKRKWHVVDAKDVVLGRLATKVADVLRGKDKPTFTPHLDAGDFVELIIESPDRLSPGHGGDLLPHGQTLKKITAFRHGFTSASGQ